MEYKDKFLDYLQYEKRYSPYTFKFYKRDLDEFEQFLEMEMLDKVSNKTIKSYMYFLSKKGNTRRTIARKLSSLKTFYRFLITEKIVQKNPFELIESPKVEKSLPRFLYKEEIEKICEEINAEIVGYTEITSDFQIEFKEDKTLDDLDEITEYLYGYPFVSFVSLNTAVSVSYDD